VYYTYSCVPTVCVIHKKFFVMWSESFQTGQKMNSCSYCRTHLIDGGRMVSAELFADDVRYLDCIILKLCFVQCGCILCPLQFLRFQKLVD